MRSILSLTVLTAVVFGTFGPAFGQRAFKDPSQITDERGRSKETGSASGRKLPGKPQQPQPNKSPKKTEFSKVEAYSDGNGTLIRWQMVTELKNAGFRVYKLGKEGEAPVSGF